MFSYVYFTFIYKLKAELLMLKNEVPPTLAKHFAFILNHERILN